MTAGKSNQRTAKAIYLSAVEIDDKNEQLAHIDEACKDRGDLKSEVEQLLAIGPPVTGNLLCRAVDRLNPCLADDAAPGRELTDVDDVSEHPLIDRYKLLEEIGRGGMGTVYMAQQTKPVKRRVALKLINPGMDSREVIARFEAERQALAMMDHLNIARVLDAGTTNAGRPYFVMELVRGVPITEYCQQHQLCLEERLRLFVNVCHAVQHAHQKGIIHRDIKPSNVMVSGSDGVPAIKVIDFGVAKALHHDLTDKTLFTQFSQLIGTPLYISPEQAGLGNQDVDTRSDIYSLGVLLYELLTGTTPFDRETLAKAGLEHARQIIREQQPLRPSIRLSTLNAADASTLNTGFPSESKRLAVKLRNELDWIVMKALEKDRTRRYESASDLEQDIERYLNNAPVQACPPSRLYLATKLVQRNRTLITLLAVAMAGLLLSVGGLSIGLSKARVERSRALAAAEQEKRARSAEAKQKQAAEAALNESDAVIEFFSKYLLRQASPQRQAADGFEADPNLTVRTALSRAADSIGGTFENQPRIEARLRFAIGDAYRNLGLAEESLEQFEKAAAFYRRTDGERGSWTLSAEEGIADSLFIAQRYDQCIPMFERLLTIYEEIREETDGNLVRLRQQLVESYLKTNQAWRAERIAEASYTTCSNVLGKDHALTVIAKCSWAQSLVAQKKYDHAITIFEELLKTVNNAKGLTDLDSLALVENLGAAYKEVGRFDDAVRLIGQAGQGKQRSLGEDHPLTLKSEANLGQTLFDAGRLHDARKLMEGVNKKARRVLAPTSETRLRAELILGQIYAKLDRRSQAIELLQHVSATYDELGIPKTHENLRPKYEWASCLIGNGEYEQAIALFRQLVQDYRDIELITPQELNAVYYNLAEAIWRHGDADQAIQILEGRLAEIRRNSRRITRLS